MRRRLLTYAMVMGAIVQLSGPAIFGPSGPQSTYEALAAERALHIQRVEAQLVNRASTLTYAEIRELAGVIVSDAQRTGLDPHLILAVIQVESSGRATVVSHAGAIGLMQLRPATAEQVALDMGVDWQGPPTLMDPTTNVRLGIGYLATLVERFGDLETALAAYNWGPTHIASRLRRGHRIPNNYSRRVLALYLDS